MEETTSNTSKSPELSFRLRSLANSLKKRVRLIGKKGIKVQKISFRNPLKVKARKRTIFLTIVAIILIIFLGFNVIKYFRIQTSTFTKEDISSQLRPVSSDFSEMNVAFLGFDDSKQSYKYLDFIVITSINFKTGGFKSYGINPNFTTSIDYTKYTLKTLYNIFDTQGDRRMNELMNEIEALSGVRIDRYIAFNYSDFGKFLDLTSMQIPAISSKKTSERFYNSGDLLARGALKDYLLNNETTDDDTVERYVNFINLFFDNFKDTVYLYKLFLQNEDILKILSTDMSKGELIKFITNAASSSQAIRTGFASVKFTNSPVDEINGGIVVSDIILDEDVSKTFSELSIIKEQAQIEIYNATDTSGVAYNHKRFYENQGGIVIKVGNYPDTVAENLLYVPKKNPEDFQNNIKMIQDDLRGDVRVIIGDYKYNYSGDLILIIGKN